MSADGTTPKLSARMIVVGNEKGGSGKSTIAMHLAIALIKAGQRIATIDLDSRQSTFTHYIENRFAWAQHIARDLEIPNHLYFTENTNNPTAEDEAADGKAFLDIVAARTGDNDFIVIDTPGHNSYIGRLAHSIADVLITPLNDSFVDLDVLGTVDRETLAVTGPSHYSRMAGEARQQRLLRDNVAIDWIVLRNRLSMLNSRNTRCVGEGLQKLSQMLNFRFVEGLAERVIFREFYPRGLTALDTLDERTLGTRLTTSHVAARLEIENLLSILGLCRSVTSGQTAGNNRAAA
jgi:chromosome partitioning protein